MTKLITARSLAAQILLNVLQKNRSLTEVLTEAAAKPVREQDRSFVQELCYGVLRWHLQLNFLLQQLLAKPLKAADADIHCLLLIGLYQLKFLNTKPHAAIFETAQAARALKKIWAVGLINGVLRQWQRQQAALEIQLVAAPPTILFAQPAWLVTQVQTAWPQHWQTILAASNQRPPLTLRVNCTQVSRAAYLEQLTAVNIAATPLALCPAGIDLSKATHVTQLPGYATGAFSVQDAGAQWAAHLLQVEPGQHVLDACAAPGGKTAHILELQPALAHLTALDNVNARLARVQENLVRLQLFDAQQVRLVCADATEPAAWWDGHLFDRILLDAPCSATGVIRRHPDIKHLRRETDIATLGQLQLQMLITLWSLLKPGGILVYATCSILPAENSTIVGNFLQTHSDAIELDYPAALGLAATLGRQLLPGVTDTDGFYYASLTKQI